MFVFFFSTHNTRIPSEVKKIPLKKLKILKLLLWSDIADCSTYFSVYVREDNFVLRLLTPMDVIYIHCICLYV